ncbi:MAG: AsnC family transcriptional regulator [Gammaproteobacteria bacterium]
MNMDAPLDVPMDALDKAIINRLQHGFPVVAEPYAAIAAELNTSTDELLQRLQRLLDNKILSRFGPMYHAERLGGALTLAAMALPEDDFDRVCEQVNTLPQVAHNYRREHTLNMWFVLATETPQEIQDTIQLIEQRSGYPVYNMPKLEEFYVGLYLQA